MKFDLQELLEQKALLEKHLAWLDAKIRQLREIETAGVKQEQPAIPEPAPPAQIIEFEDQLKPSTEPLAQNTKIGCVVLSAAIILLFLYLLFGLPYQIYKDKKENNPAQKQP